MNERKPFTALSKILTQSEKYKSRKEKLVKSSFSTVKNATCIYLYVCQGVQNVYAYNVFNK